MRWLILGIGAVLTLVGASPAWAAPATEVVQGQYIRIVSTADWEAAGDLRPGIAIPWDLEISADAPEPGSMTLSLSATGGLPLSIDAQLCAQRWHADECPGGVDAHRLGWEIPLDGSRARFASVTDTDVAHVRLTVAMAPDASGEGSTVLKVHADGIGDPVVVGPGGHLATTGAAPGAAWMLGAGIAILSVGAGLLIAGRVRRRVGENHGKSA